MYCHWSLAFGGIEVVGTETDTGFKDTFTCEGDSVSTSRNGTGTWDRKRLFLRFNDYDYAPVQH
jgi:hypothetical protein